MIMFRTTGATREKNTLDLILTSLPGQFQEIHTRDKLSDHGVISGTLKIHIPLKRHLGGSVFVPKGKFRINEERYTRLCKAVLLLRFHLFFILFGAVQFLNVFILTLLCVLLFNLVATYLRKSC